MRPASPQGAGPHGPGQQVPGPHGPGPRPGGPQLGGALAAGPPGAGRPGVARAVARASAPVPAGSAPPAFGLAPGHGDQAPEQAGRAPGHVDQAPEQRSIAEALAAGEARPPSVPSGVLDGDPAPGDPGRPPALGEDGDPDARSAVRRRERERRRLRLVGLVMACLLVLAALPLYFGIRAATRDPVFTSLDELKVPDWATGQTVDDVSGSRWCLIDCRLRERTTHSERGPDETTKVYERALADAGWRPWKAPLCPEQPVDGHYTCWKRDELTLDLWARTPTCTAVPAPSGQPAPPPDARKPASPAPGAGECAGSLVSVKVRNAIDDDRTQPQPSTDPSLTGEDPLPLSTGDPLRDLIPTPS